MQQVLARKLIMIVVIRKSTVSYRIVS